MEQERGRKGKLVQWQHSLSVVCCSGSKNPDRTTQVRKKGFALAPSSRLESRTTGELECLESEVASHIHSQEQREDEGIHACTWLTVFPLRQYRIPYVGNGAAHSGLVLFTSINSVKTTSLRPANRPA